MRWRKITKFFILVLILSTVLLAYLANRNMSLIYGGLTEVANHKKFNVPNNSVTIHNVNILSPSGDSFILNQTVHLDDGIITSINADSIKSKDVIHIDGEGKFLIPGLIDAHVHLFSSQNDLLLYIANGVTSIRELSGQDEHLTWRQQIKDGRIGPGMYITSPRLGSFGLIEGWFMNWSQGFNNITDADEAKTLVKNYAKKGYNGVKVYSYLNNEAFETINKFAETEGLDVVGHIPFSLDLSDIFSSNQSDITHLEEVMNAFRREFGKLQNEKGANEFLDYVDERSKEIAPELIDNNISVTSTLWLTQSFVRQKFELNDVLKEVELVYVNPGISEWDEMIPQGLGWLPEVNRYKMPENLDDEEKAWQRIFWTTYAQACAIILKNLSDGGVNIMAGTDANLPPAVPGFSLHNELIAMVEAGLSASQVLQSATSIPSDWLDINTGRIKSGYKANLVLLEKNPLKDISNTSRINTVFLNGRAFDRAMLDDLLESVKTANNKSREKEISQFLIDEN